MTYGETIRAARVLKRMTLRQLGKKLDVTAPYLCDIEKDRRALSPEKEKLVCRVLDIHPEVLEASRGYTRELADWIRDSPDIIRLLRRHRSTGAVVRIGGENCSCRRCR